MKVRSIDHTTTRTSCFVTVASFLVSLTIEFALRGRWAYHSLDGHPEICDLAPKLMDPKYSFGEPPPPKCSAEAMTVVELEP